MDAGQSADAMRRALVDMMAVLHRREEADRLYREAVLRKLDTLAALAEASATDSRERMVGLQTGQKSLETMMLREGEAMAASQAKLALAFAGSIRAGVEWSWWRALEIAERFHSSLFALLILCWGLRGGRIRLLGALFLSLIFDPVATTGMIAVRCLMLAKRGVCRRGWCLRRQPGTAESAAPQGSLQDDRGEGPPPAAATSGPFPGPGLGSVVVGLVSGGIAWMLRSVGDQVVGIVEGGPALGPVVDHIV